MKAPQTSAMPIFIEHPAPLRMAGPIRQYRDAPVNRRVICEERRFRLGKIGEGPPGNKLCAWYGAGLRGFSSSRSRVVREDSSWLSIGCDVLKIEEEGEDEHWKEVCTKSKTRFGGRRSGPLRAADISVQNSVNSDGVYSERHVVKPERALERDLRSGEVAFAPSARKSPHFMLPIFEFKER